MTQTEHGYMHIERILLVCGESRAGKSPLIRAMVGDKRLAGEVPTERVVPPCPLSRERVLAIRCTSPHEHEGCTDQFHARIQGVATRLRKKGYRRMNYVSAIWPQQHKNMPAIVQACHDLISVFAPERLRVVQLAPDQQGRLDSQLSDQEIDALRRLKGVGTLRIDARKPFGDPCDPGNVGILADFFDFS